MVVPPKHPKWSFLVGKPMVVGYHHFRKPPYATKWFRSFSSPRRMMKAERCEGVFFHWDSSTYICYAVLHHVILSSSCCIFRLWDLRRRSCETNWEKRSLDATKDSWQGIQLWEVLELWFVLVGWMVFGCLVWCLWGALRILFPPDLLERLIPLSLEYFLIETETPSCPHQRLQQSENKPTVRSVRFGKKEHIQ